MDMALSHIEGFPHDCGRTLDRSSLWREGSTLSGSRRGIMVGKAWHIAL